MFNNICKTIICLGGLLFATSCTSHRTVYITEAQLKAAPESIVVDNQVPDVIVFDDGREYFLYERRVRRYRPYYYSRDFFGPRYYVPGYYARPRSHVEFQFGMGFSKRFR